MDENLKQETTNLDPIEVVLMLKGDKKVEYDTKIMWYSILAITVIVVCLILWAPIFVPAEEGVSFTVIDRLRYFSLTLKNTKLSGVNLCTWILMLFMMGIGIRCINFDVSINKKYIQHMNALKKELNNLFKSYSFGQDYGSNGLDRDPLNQVMKKSILGDDWLILSNSDNYIKTYEKEESIRKYMAIDIHAIFDAQVSFQSIVEYNRRIQMPSIMTGLGILGTFFGLTIGLYGLNLASSGNELSSQVTSLVSSSGTAFSTSLLGIVFSLIYTFVLNYQKSRAIRAYENVINILYAHIPYISTEELLMSLDRSICEQKSAIEQMAEDIASQLEASFNEKVPQALANSLSPNFQAIETGLNNVSTGLENMKKSFESFQSNTSKGIGDALIASASNEINALGNTLGKLNAAVNSLMAQNGQDREDHKELINTMSNMLSSSAENIVGLTSAFKDSAKGMVTSMDEKIKESLQSMQERQDAMMNAMNQTLETIQMTQGQLLTDTSNEFKASAGEITKLAGGFAESAQSMVDRVNTKVNDELELIHKQQESIVTTMNNALGEIHKRQTSLLGTIQEQLGTSAQDFTKMVNDLQTISRDLTESLHGEAKKSAELLTNNVQANLVEMNRVVASITADIRKDNKIAQEELATMTKDLLVAITETTTNGLKESMDSLHGTLSEAQRIVEGYAKKQETSMKEIEKLSAAVEHILLNAGDTVQNMDQTLDTSKEVLVAMTEGNKQIVDNVASISDVVSKMESYEKQMNLNVTKVESVIADQQVKIANQVKPLIDSLDTSTKANAQSIMAVKTTVASLEKAWQNHEETYEGFTSELQDIFNEIVSGINTYHEQLNDRMQGTMKDFDIELSHAVSTLNATVSQLIDGQESFKEVIDKRVKALQAKAGAL